MRQSHESEKARSIRIPRKLWEALDSDTERCKRTSTKQLEAILSAYYGFDDVQLDRDRVEAVRVLVSRKPGSSIVESLPVTTDVHPKKKRISQEQRPPLRKRRGES